MKSEQDIIDLRYRTMAAVREFGTRHGLPFVSSQSTPSEIHHMALGAIAFANTILETPGRPDNLGKLIEAMELVNERLKKASNA